MNDHPILYTSLVFREVNTHFTFPPIISKSLGIVLVADLRHGDVGRLLIFQLEGVKILLSVLRTRSILPSEVVCSTFTSSAAW